MEVWKDFVVECAHKLPNVPAGHKCGRLHGHSIGVRIAVRGDVAPESGWVVDFADLKTAFMPIFDELDHKYLNDVPGLENPTSENIAKFIYSRLAGSLLGLCYVEVKETCTSGVRYSE